MSLPTLSSPWYKDIRQIINIIFERMKTQILLKENKMQVLLCYCPCNLTIFIFKKTLIYLFIKGPVCQI